MPGTLVLLVEDEALILVEVEAALHEAGFSTKTFACAEKAMEAFDAEPEAFSAVVTDIRLAGSASGFDLARHIRHRAPAIPVIYMSADSAADWRSEGVPESIMVAKPFACAQIITGLATLLNAASAVAASSGG